MLNEGTKTLLNKINNSSEKYGSLIGKLEPFTTTAAINISTEDIIKQVIEKL